MRLSKESLVGLASAIMMYFEIKGENITELLQESLNGDKIEYFYSDNIENHLKNKESDEN